MNNAHSNNNSSPLDWADTIPPEQIEAHTHPMPSLHDQDEVDHVIHSTFKDMGKPARSTPMPTPKDRGHLSACALVAASLACGYAFGSALVALSNL